MNFSGIYIRSLHLTTKLNKMIRFERNTELVYEGKSVTNFISSIDGDLKELAKKVNRYFKTRNDVIRTEDELLRIIHGKDVLREILAHIERKRP